MGLLKKPSSIVIGISIKPYSSKKKIRGHRFHLPGCSPIQPEPTGDIQFVGVHRCMCITIRRPWGWGTLLKVAEQMPQYDPFGFVTWLGGARATPRLKGKNRGAEFYIQRHVWEPKERKGFHTKGIIHPVVIGRGGFIVYMLEIPAIQRYRVVPEYIENF